MDKGNRESDSVFLRDYGVIIADDWRGVMIMRLLIQLLVAVLFLVSCSSGRLISTSQLQIRDGVAYQPGKEDVPFTGTHVVYWEDGSKQAEGNYKEGRQHGLVTVWFKNAQKWVEVNYKEGQLHGLTTGWYENGQKKVEGSYKEGRQHGLATSWYENGQKRNEVIYKEGQRQ